MNWYALCGECDRMLMLLRPGMVAGEDSPLSGQWLHLDDDGTPLPKIDRDDHDADPIELEEREDPE